MPGRLHPHSAILPRRLQAHSTSGCRGAPLGDSVAELGVVACVVMRDTSEQQVEQTMTVVVPLCILISCLQ
jgi:hypothetical protein